MSEESLNFLPLLLVVGFAALIPLLLARFKRIPVVVGEIILGVIIGRSGLGLVHGEFTLELLAEIGFAFLMFLSGLEIDFSILLNPSRTKEKGLGPLGIASISFTISVVLALLASYFIVNQGMAQDPWMMALILSTTSLGIVVPVLKERQMTASKYGQTVLLAALLADFLTMLLITIYVAGQSTGLRLEILLIGVLFITALLIYRVGSRSLKIPAVTGLIDQISGATSQFKVRTALALLMGFVVLAESVGVELILGAFLAGAVVSLLSRPEDQNLKHNLEAMGYGFFIPVFFIMVGVEFDLPVLLGDPSAVLLAPLLLLIAFVVKIAGSLAFRLQFSWRESIGSGMLLSARLSLIIAAAAVGLRIGVISPATNSAIILIAALTATVSPMVFGTIFPPVDIVKRRHYLIHGGANIGLAVAQELRAHGEQICFSETDKRIAKFVKKEGFPVMEGVAFSECIAGEDLAKVKAMLILSADDDNNLEAAKTAKAMGIENVIALVNEPAKLSDFADIGTRAFVPSMLRPKLLATMARNPNIFRLLTSTEDDQDIREVRLRNPGLVGREIGKVVLPGDTLVLTIRRNGDVLIPHGSTRMEMDDQISILGSIDSLDDAQALFRKTK